MRSVSRKRSTTRHVKSESLLRRWPWHYLLLLLVLIGTAMAVRHAFSFLGHSAAFRVSALEIRGLHRLSGDEVLAATEIAVGTNVFAVDLDELAARIGRLPLVERVLVARKPPDRIVVSVRERQRLAWVELGEVYGIDYEGVLLPTDDKIRESVVAADLPVISGLGTVADSLYPGVSLTDSLLISALSWWRQAAVYDADFCKNISEIQPLGGDGIRLLLVGDGLEVRLPADRVAEHLRILKKLMVRVYRECPDPAYIDLRYAGQVVVGTDEPGRGSRS